MLSQWQLTLLDNGHWILPVAAAFGLVAFPWKHWNSIWENE